MEPFSITRWLNFLGYSKRKTQLPSCSLTLGAGSGRVDVTLDNMPVEAAVEGHAAFDVDEGAFLPGIEVAFSKRFIDGGYPVGVFSVFPPR